MCCSFSWLFGKQVVRVLMSASQVWGSTRWYVQWGNRESCVEGWIGPCVRLCNLTAYLWYPGFSVFWLNGQLAIISGVDFPLWVFFCCVSSNGFSSFFFLCFFEWFFFFFLVVFLLVVFLLVVFLLVVFLLLVFVTLTVGRGRKRGK